MTHFRQIFTLILLSSCIACIASDDDGPASSNNSVASSQGSAKSNPENGHIDNKTGLFVSDDVQLAQAQTPIPDFADELPEGSPYRGSVSGENHAMLLGDGVYHLSGTEKYILCVDNRVGTFSKEAIKSSILECNTRTE